MAGKEYNLFIMWGAKRAHDRPESQPLTTALEAVFRNKTLAGRAEATLRGMASQEPLFAESLKTPQTPPYHCEGPFLEDHLRIALTVLYGLIEGDIHLLDIEEFRRLKGYEGEIQELEDTLKEYAALFEVFVLCHDTAKWATVSFSVLPGSEGEKLGFKMDASSSWEDIGASDRAKLRARYIDLFEKFALKHKNLSARALELMFYESYGIRAHFLGHDRAIHSPHYQSFLHRVAGARRLTSRDTAIVEDVIARHLEPIGSFSMGADPGKIESLVRLSHDRGYDPDDFIDILQGAVFLDAVVSSVRHDGHVWWHDASVLVNFLRAEHDFAPWKRAEKASIRGVEKTKERNRLFREAGLDGMALMELLKMDPGPSFGKTMRIIHDAIVGHGKMPRLPVPVLKEIEDRAQKFYRASFL